MNKIKLFGVLLVVIMAVVFHSNNVKAANLQEDVNDNLLVKYIDGVNKTQRDNIREKYGIRNSQLKDFFESINTEIWYVDSLKRVELKKQLSQETEIEYVQEDQYIELDREKKVRTRKEKILQEPYFIYQWGLNNSGQLIGDYGIPGIDTNALKAWEVTEGSPQVIVGVLDTGIDIEHNDLKSNIYFNNNEILGNGIDDDENGYIDDITGWDFLHNDNTVFESPNEDCHGTYVSGIIAGQKDGSGVVGLAPNVKILPLKFMSAEGGSTSNAIRAIEYAKKMHVKIINCSWSGDTYNAALRDEMKNSNVLFLCSAGNEGKNIDNEPVYPACFDIDNLVTVGSFDNRGVISVSNWGQQVDLVAPGVNVISTFPQNMYIFASGTSGATPFVTAAAALALSIHPSLTNTKLVTAICDSVDKDVNNFYNIKTEGRLNAWNLLKLLEDVN